MQEQSHPVRSISAVTLLTSDMHESVVFYGDLGFEMLYGGVDAGFTSFRAGTGFLNLQLTSEGRARESIWGRVIFWVDDVDEMYHRVLGAGYEPGTQPADAPWGERYFHVRDPDGHELSFARPLDPG
jgi:catechol 2,3-dioxygenase-like lactoylglutathione lyase family enzyme